MGCNAILVGTKKPPINMQGCHKGDAIRRSQVAPHFVLSPPSKRCMAAIAAASVSGHKFVDTQGNNIPANEAYEHSELILYKAMVLEEGGRLEDALRTLDSEKGMIKDLRGMMEMRAAILMKAGRLQEAEQQYRALLQANPDHYRYHEGLQAAMGLRPEVPAAETSATTAVVAATALSDDQRARLTALYADLIATYPRSSSCRRILLDFLQGEAFLALADTYVRKYLLRGVPSLFMDLRPLYR
ncbi:NMDA receptor-regulated protein 1-domain-containing protein [Dunaliella salina]|uniref:NMDA receptor-regulated protein 1-domain-containing protein n=1 Tax=Dunaliella salina TaxID=3046 RepID=A0ABQ7GFM5_DUNSA|nr:NMDA receptor-regulated protein 1-domain-containing protein [Dunaliella salina]|eukprot:KAF5833412.1 NMDA receptor-regulated protein 1-domain-containing protein [Dunaliella salina]